MSWQWESEPFRVFRSSCVDAQRATMGELYGILTRAITELAAREDRGALVALMLQTKNPGAGTGWMEVSENERETGEHANRQVQLADGIYYLF